MDETIGKRNDIIGHAAIECESPIFVVGAPRSGTTLVAKILGRHQDIFPAGESHFFEDVWSRREELEAEADGDALGPAVDRTLTLFGRFQFPDTQEMVDSEIGRRGLLTEAKRLGGGYDALYYALMQGLAERAGKKRFCDDTPKHLYYLHEILEMFPNARIIGCVRDPRDFLCSYKNYWQSRSVVQRKRIRALYHPIVTSLLWRSSTNSLLKHAEDCCRENLLLVQYEHLVENPAGVVEGMCDFVGANFDERMIQIEDNNSSFDRASSGIFTTSVGRWGSCLTTEEAWWAQRLTGNNMEKLGYQVEVVGPARVKLLRILLDSPVHLARALWVNKARRGPVLRYMWRRFLSLVQK